MSRHSGKESPRAVRAAPPEDGGGSGWSLRVRQDNFVAHFASGHDEARKRGQAICHEPEGHAENTGLLLLITFLHNYSGFV